MGDPIHRGSGRAGWDEMYSVLSRSMPRPLRVSQDVTSSNA